MALDNNDGYIKGYDQCKTLPKITRSYNARVIDDELKFIVKNQPTDDPDVQRCIPSLGALGRWYEQFDENGYKVKGIQLKSKHIEIPLQSLYRQLGGFGGGLSREEEEKTKGNVRIQEELMNRVSLKRSQGWMSTKVVADRRINFPDQPYIIRNKQDVINIQKALVAELDLSKSAWVVIKRLILEHKASGREIVNILSPVVFEEIEQKQLYTAWIEKTNGVMSPIDNYSGEQLDFLYEGNGHNVYPLKCAKEVGTQIVQVHTCAGLVNPLIN
jgi:hypothetical protein